ATTTVCASLRAPRPPRRRCSRCRSGRSPSRSGRSRCADLGVHDGPIWAFTMRRNPHVGERDRQTMGTPRYMAPEQMDGGEVSPQTDQYALALVVYEMLTGRLPWDVNMQDRKALAEAHRHAAPTPPSRFCPWLPARMDAALLKALSKDPRARHDTLHGLMFELRGLQWIGDRPGMTGD